MSNLWFICCKHQWKNSLAILCKSLLPKQSYFNQNGALKSTKELAALDVNKKVYLKSAKLIEIGAKDRAFFASNLLCDEQQDLFRKEY